MLPVQCPQTGADRQRGNRVKWCHGGQRADSTVLVGVTATLCLRPLKKHLGKKEKTVMPHVHSVLRQIRPGAGT